MQRFRHENTVLADKFTVEPDLAAAPLRALDADKERLVDFARKYFLPALEEGKTARVVFGTQDIESSGDYEVLQSDAWTFHNPMSFLSSKYFEEKKNE